MDAELCDQFSKRLDALDSKENYFLDLAAEEGWPKGKIRSKVAAIRDERKTITASLDRADRQLKTGRDLLHQALDLLANLQAMYHAHVPTQRPVLTSDDRIPLTEERASGEP